MKISAITFFILGLICIAIGEAQACKLSIPERDVTRFLNPPVSGHYLKCEDYPEDKCHCVEAIDPWSAELTDNLVLDFIRKEKAVSCIDEAECIAKESEQICDLGKVIRTETEVYCAVEAYKKDGVKLVESEAKKAAKIAANKALADAEKAKADKCKNFSFKGSTIAQLKAELNESLECGR